ncbi:MAG: hypothetical protein H7138_08295 [Myxococcales bacterium]|nr:hypothetical protein [Myxococcales bacterium]
MKKSVAAITPKCALRKVFHGIGCAALGSGIQAILEEDALDRVSPELVAEVAERATDPRVAPARVLGGELNDQALQRRGGAGAAALSFSGAVVFLGDELAVPAQDGVGRDQSGELFQRTSADEAALRAEPPALGIGEAQAPPSELLAQDAVLVLEVRDDLGLVAVHPAREHHEQELQRCDRHLRRSYPRRARRGRVSSENSQPQGLRMVSTDPVLAPDGAAAGVHPEGQPRARLRRRVWR